MFYNILTNTDNEVLLRKQVEDFLHNNYNVIQLQSYEVGFGNNNLLTLSISEKVMYKNKLYEIEDIFYVTFGEDAEHTFYDFNYVTFKDGFTTTSGIFMKPNFIVGVSCDFLDKGVEKFGLQLIDKLLDITKGYMTTDLLSNYLQKEYVNDILLAVYTDLIYDSEKYTDLNLYLLFPNLIKEIIKNDLLIQYEPH